MFVSLLKSQSSLEDYTLELITIKDKADSAKFCLSYILKSRCNYWGFFIIIIINTKPLNIYSQVVFLQLYR